MGAHGRDRVAISIFPISNRPTPMCARLLPAARRCRSGICSRKSFMSPRGAAQLRFGRKTPAKSPLNGRRARSSPIPLNASYIHYNGSRDEPVRLFAGTTCPRMINIFHNEDFIFRNPFNFRDRFHEGDEFLRYNKHMAERYWETNLVPDVNQFALDDFPMKGKGVKHMRFTLADTTYGCHVSEFPPGCRSTFHRHGPGGGDHHYARRRLRRAVERRRRTAAPSV